MTVTQNAPTTAGAERRYATVNPFTGETEKEYPFTETSEIDGIIGRAHSAYLEWRDRSVEERAAVVRRAAELIDERIMDLAALTTKEMGKRRDEAVGELFLCSMILKYYADNGPKFLEPTPIEPMMGGGEAVVETKPVGALLAIEPWNFPYYQVVRVVGPNLVLGNTVILKHSEITPQCAEAIEQVFTDAGAPAGVFQNTFLRISDVEQVIADPRIQGVTLTGSERAGSSVAALAGKHLKKSVLELGGSDPFIVLDAQDMEATIKAATAGRMQNTGQACTASKRLIVTEENFEPFVEGLKQAFTTFAPGDPSDPSTSLAPLSSERAAADLQAQIQDAIDKGATVVAGGKRPERPGAFVEPTILTDVTPDMRAYREELFGPAAVVYKVKDADEAVALANDSDFGLGATVMSSDLDRARDVADRLDVGMVWINQPTGSSPELPFGGIKRSGYGRELSELAMFEFANRRLVRTIPAKKADKPQAG
ncbi:NAD-dependent succinate-semialdehyde dehydrogenase [Blastococcus sp. CCUG 61487]|uniref:NAD-dependent succinate-semialdehyde dehydrogenase n=1 Tax=Blastococcus sp. CCUG 61487 TaxID=1840703 RepID=UPI001135E135|nr:NAD-dependent succinate-semialdehyde dehydrogenase [Blastococcus sp. CCUG 61487]TKJ30978.1 succinate-semialdehyde dehydrogenase [Blastococcus sp. CCUG 61487]